MKIGGEPWRISMKTDSHPNVTISLLPDFGGVTARTSGELEVNVDKLFDEGGGGKQVEQGDSVGGGKGVDIEPTVAVDAREPSHPPKKLREDYGYPSGPSIAGKSRSAVQRLFAGAVLNAEVRGEPILTLPFVTSSVSATPERKNENLADFVTGPNLRTISAPQRFVISLNSSHHSGANIAEAEVDSIVRSFTPIIATVMTATVDAVATAKETPVKPSLFGAGSSSAGGTDLTPGGFSDVSGSDFLIGGIHIVVEPDFDLQKLFTEFNVGAACQVSLSAEVRMRAEYNIKEKRKLRAVVEDNDILLKAKGEEVDSLKAQLLVKEAEAAKAIRLRTEASKFEVVEKYLRDEVESLKECNTTLEKEKSMLDVRVSDLVARVKVRELEAADSDAMVTAMHALEVTCSGLRDQILTYEGLKEQFEEFQDV
ncbi:hypothetical protein Tco_0838647 [Tanacetum coccineum]|uniref:Uncharacterized protein n=1 Tax=Tanacetum coccineum TaxID=301880 RepID=A0ABQ5AND8_9ASTR